MPSVVGLKQDEQKDTVNREVPSAEWECETAGLNHRCKLCNKDSTMCALQMLGPSTSKIRSPMIASFVVMMPSLW